MQTVSYLQSTDQYLQTVAKKNLVFSAFLKDNLFSQINFIDNSTINNIHPWKS